MRSSPSDTSPRTTARIAGLLYLVITVAAPFGEVYVRGRLIVKGDAAATAANIGANESLYRLGGSADLVAFACDVAVALLLYELLKPVSRSLSLMAAFFRLMHAAIVAVATLAFFAPLLILGGAPHMRALRLSSFRGSRSLPSGCTGRDTTSGSSSSASIASWSAG